MTLQALIDKKISISENREKTLSLLENKAKWAPKGPTIYYLINTLSITAPAIFEA